MTSMNYYFGVVSEVTLKINTLGINKDYYIALGLCYNNYYEFPFKKFYWATSSNFVFAPLPSPNDQHKKDVDERETLFFGEPEKIVVEVKPPEEGEGDGLREPDPEPKAEDKKEGEEGENPEGQSDIPENLDDTVEVAPVIIPKNLTELDRLAFIVAAIENDTHVVPQGGFKLIPKHEIRRNPAFKGLDKDTLGDLKKYYHFRNVQSENKKAVIESAGSVFREDIFDPIIEDKPKGSWSIQIDSSKTIATIKSLLWPGYVAYNVLGTKKFGGAYFGDGLKNKELTFML